jgi:hypothetical protein
MVDQRTPARSRGLLRPVIGGLTLIAVIILVIYFRNQVWDALKWTGRQLSDWLTNWVPDHPGQTAAIAGFAVFAFVVNWIAHVRGRFRAWIFALVVEIGLWLLFWYGLGIPSLNSLFGLDIPRMSMTAVLLSAVVVIAITGAIFWFLESREEWRKYRHRLSTDDD